MSALVDYVSSSEEEEETSPSDTTLRHSQHEPVLSPTATPSETDYFGLDSDSESDSLSHDEPQSKLKLIDSTDQGDTMQVETPSTRFWTNDAHVNYKWTSHLTDTDDSPTQSSVGDSISTSATRKASKLNKNIQSRKRKFNDTLQTEQTKCDNNVKFYIHHRMKPFLHQTIARKVPSAKKLHIPNAHESAVNTVSWNFGQYSHMLLTASMDQTVKVWNLFSPSMQPLSIYSNHDKAVKQAVWCSDGKQCLTASYDKTCRLIDVVSGQQKQEFEHSSFVSCVKPHPVNQNVFITGCANHLMAWDMRDCKKHVKKFTYKDTFGQVQDLAFIQNGSQMLSCNDFVTRDSTDRNIMAWDFQSGVVLSNQIYQERFTCTRLLSHPSEPDFVAQSQGNYMAIFSTVRPYKMNRCKRFEGHKVGGYNIGCSFSQDGKYLYSGSSDGKVYMYDYHRGKLCGTLPLDRGTVCMDVACHPVLPSALAAGTWSGELWLWE